MGMSEQRVFVSCIHGRENRDMVFLPGSWNIWGGQGTVSRLRESQEIFTFTRAQSNVRICNIFATQEFTNRNHFHRQTKMPYLEETMEQEIILEARNITKVYPGGVVANHNVNLQIKKGEIHALVGENGAGKSTLMKMLFGMLAPTEGQIFVVEKRYISHHPAMRSRPDSAWYTSISCRFRP